MRSFTLLSLATAALAAPSLVERSPAGCQSTYDGTFEITVFKTAAAKRDLERRAGCTSDEGALILTLNGGTLKDKKDRTGYIADNRQFQFDGPVQAGAIKSSGFSVCTNGSLALDDSTVWYQCLSGNFYNLYDRHWAPQCEEVTIVAMSCGDGSSSGAVGQTSDGQPQATTVVTQIGDGQVQGPTKVPVITQIGDGQIQAPTGAPVTQIGDGQIQVPSSIAPKPTGAPVTQIGDGQVQAPTKIATKAPVTQISDGQVQAPTGAPVTQIGDGQVQAPTGAPVTQIGDGQVQAPTGAPVTQIGDGQVQAPTSVGTIQPTTVPSPSVSLLPPSAGSQILPGSFALIVAALGAVFAL